MIARFYFPEDNTVLNRSFITTSFKYTQVYHNNLDFADNNANIEIIFDTELSEKLKIQDKKDIKVEIKNDDLTNLITGYVRKNYSFKKTQKNQPIKIEIVSPSFLLDKKLSETMYYANRSVEDIAHYLLNAAGFTNYITYGLESIVPVFFEDADNNTIKTILQELLFEYGYTFDFDNDGDFILLPLFDNPPDTITQILNGNNCQDSIAQTKKEEEYQNVVANWSPIQIVNNTLLFRDTQNAGATEVCHINIQPTSYMFDNEFNYLEYDNTNGEVLYTEIGIPDFKYSTNDVELKSFENLGKRAKVSIYNNASTANWVTQLDIYGNAYVKLNQSITKNGDFTDESKSKEIELKYLFDTNVVDAFVKRLTNYYKYADFTVTTKSKIDFKYGSFVSIIDEGIGTIIGRIIQKQYTLKSSLITYTIEAIREYIPTSDTSTNVIKETKDIDFLILENDKTAPTIPIITGINFGVY
jgi:hypothetical protein